MRGREVIPPKSAPVSIGCLDIGNPPNWWRRLARIQPRGASQLTIGTLLAEAPRWPHLECPNAVLHIVAKAVAMPRRDGMVHNRGDSCSVGARPRRYSCHPIYPLS